VSATAHIDFLNVLSECPEVYDALAAPELFSPCTCKSCVEYAVEASYGEVGMRVLYEAIYLYTEFGDKSWLR
jgi:hypothetical protein